MAKHANNKRVWLNLRDAFPFPYDVDDARHWIASVAHQDPRVSFVIEVDGEVCGSIGLKAGSDMERVSAELGYWLGESVWGRGIATEAATAITDYALNKLRFSRIFAVPMIHNGASFRVLEKAGFQREGVLRKACIKNGEIRDMVMYSRVSDDLLT